MTPFLIGNYKNIDILRVGERMARPRELLTLARIAEETGISYPTLRNYAVKYGAEIPSEGFGRNTRYPRAAVKVFQRLRRESRPGRKPAGARAAVEPDVVETVETVEPVEPARAERAVPPPVDTGRIERQLAAIEAHLGSIAESLRQWVSQERSRPAPAPAPPAPAEPVPAAPAAGEAPAPPAAAEVRKGVPLETAEFEERGSHRRLHSMPKVRGQRGKRPD